jgi:monoamine oxidase
MEQVERDFAALAATVDPDDPWSHPDAVALDDMSVTGWLGAIGATPNVRRALEAGQLGLSSGSFERTSLLALLRKCASTSSKGLYSYDEWENLRVAEGSATVARRMAAELDGRIRLGSPVRAVKVAPGGCTVQLESGEIVAADAIVSALPAGPLRDITVDGVSDARLESLHRQRHALAAKFVAAYDRPFWRDRGQNGLTESEGILGSSWPQNEGVLSCLVAPERFAAYLSTSARHRRQEALAELGDWFGPEARNPLATFERLWGTDQWTQGYVTQWRPGDVHRVGPLHGTHEPPFYVCGSDQWVAGYMEGAVRTGRAAAREALVRG